MFVHNNGLTNVLAGADAASLFVIFCSRVPVLQISTANYSKHTSVWYGNQKRFLFIVKKHSYTIYPGTVFHSIIFEFHRNESRLK